MQRLIDQADVDGGLAAARHAVQKRNARLFRVHLRKQTLIRCLLLGGKLRRGQQPVRRGHCGAEHLALGQRNVSQLRKPSERRHRRAGQIADLLTRAASDGAEQLQHGFLQRRAARFLLRKRHGLLCGDVQRDDLLGLGAHTLRHVHTGRDQAASQQEAERVHERRLVRKLLTQSRKTSAAAAILDRLHDGKRRLVFCGGGTPVPVGNDSIGIGRLEPEAGRQDRTRRLIKRAVIALANECRQPELPLREDRLVIQTALNTLELCLLARAELQNDALRHAVAAPERHKHPHSGPHAQLRRRHVGIGLIDGVQRGRDRNSGDHKTPPSKTVKA